jgi:fibronectin-binding autotransporter adhesin
MFNPSCRLAFDSRFDRLCRLLDIKSRRRVSKRRLLFESLETRKVLANFEVTSMLDTTDANDGAVTLREAIASANASAATPDTITFAEGLSGTIELTQGPLQITDSVVITGNGAANTIIDAKQASRVLNIEGTSIDVGLSGLAITGGRTTGDNQVGETIHSGGGIRFLSGGSLTITDSTVSANSTTGIRALGGAIYSSSGNVIVQRSNVLGNSTSGYSAGGGGILTNSGNVTLTRSTLSDNRTTGEIAFGGGISTQRGTVTLSSSNVSNNRTTGGSGSGGGIYSFSGSVALTSSTVSGNSTAGDSSIGGGIFTVSASVTLTDSFITNNSTGGNSSSGGGIFAATGNVTLNSSTVSGNRTAGTTSRGGGIYARAGNVTLTGSTLSGNQATGAGSDGGGLWFDNSIVTILNSTITANTASGAGGGLGMRADPTDKKLTIHNTILAGNTATSDADFTAPTTPATNLDVKSSLIGTNAGTTLAAAASADANGNLIGTPAALLDPKLGPLSLNGGTTQTHALLADSPAINAGSDSLVDSTQVNDQRGAPFGRKNGVVDMGAYELRVLDPSFFIVTTLNDELDYSNTAVSLREAINSANGSVGTDTITFDFGLSGTIALSASLGQLPIAASLIINGNGANNTVVDAGKQGFRVIEVTGDSTDVTLSGMTITGGQTTSAGGGINFDSLNGTLILDHSTLSDNSADTGGGMFNTGLATLNHSTLSGNSARRGGGIDSYRGVILNHSTLSGNSAVALGGGILNRGTTTLNHSTLSGNTANLGGGVYNNSTITLNNSTLSGNTSNRAGGGMFNNGTATLNNSTLARNSAGTSGGGLYNNAGRTATLNNSIVVGSVDGGDIFGAVTGNANLIGNPTSAGGLVHGTGGNILGADDGAGGRRLIDVATVLAPLAFNGGPTMTHALVPNSPAINAGSDALVDSTQVNDQRGAPFARKNGVVDIGAYELRVLDPSFFIVTTFDDELDYSNSAVSLREAINSANGNVGTDTITFSPSLSTSGPPTIFLEFGELPITESIVIDGPGQELLVINARQLSRVLNVIGGTAIDVSLEGITLTGGRTTGSNQLVNGVLETTHSGGGIRFDSTGTLTLTGSTVSGNTTTGTYARGGGIFTLSGAVTLIGSTVSGNRTTGRESSGGGIHSRFGNVKLTDSTISGNSTSGAASRGGGLYTRYGNAEISRSTISGNSTSGGTLSYGGGIHMDSGALVMNESTVSNNSTTGDDAFGGGIRTNNGTVTLSGTTVSDNFTTGGSASGGGIFTRLGAVTLADSVVSGNRTTGRDADGGGIYSIQGEVTLTNSTISGNSTTGDYAGGGGVYARNGALTLTRSTVSGNRTSGRNSNGGGIYSSYNGATLTLIGSTISGNQVTGTNSDGGGVGFNNSVVTIINSTITGNSATRAGGGLGIIVDRFDKKLTIHNSIIAGNTAASNPDFTAPNDPANNLEVRFSLIGNNAGTTLTLPATGGNLIGTATDPLDPKLGPLVSGGGPTQTHALLPGSPALDAADQTLLPAEVRTDQRGVTRVIDLINVANPTGKTGLDIGAVEMIGVSIANATANESAATIDFVVTLSHAIPSGSSVSVDFSTANINGQAIAGTDYTALNQRIVFVGGGELTTTVAVPLLNDSLDESNETFAAAITNVAGAIITQGDAIGTITDDDTRGITVSAISGNTTEAGGTATFTVVLTSQPTADVTIPLSSSDTTEGTVAPTTLTFTPANWNVAQTVTVTGVNDDIDDGDIAFNIVTAAATGGDYAGLDASDVAVTNVDNDAPPTVTLSRNNANIAEAGGTSTITATLSIASSQPVTIELGFSGTATLTDDFTLTATQIVIAPGQTSGIVTVTAVQDATDEVNETIIVDITAVTNGTEATPAQQVTVTITDDDEPLDFGDAPARYPVTLAQNGARHTLGPLFLGETVDDEVDGTPSANADSDDGDDGVFVLSTFITTNVATTSSFSVIASQPGKLDAWIDFNNNGDWSDAGEKVFNSVNVVAGTNLLSFTVPAGATSGSTGARFRLSTAGNLAPIGAATDGEVEDYLAVIVPGSSTAALRIDAPGGNTNVVIEGENLVVRQGTTIISRVPFASFGELNLNGSSLDDILQLTILEALATTQLVFDGGLGMDFLVLVEAGKTLDLTDANITIREIEGIDIRGTGNNTLVISIDAVKAASSSTDTLEVVSNVGDTITFGNGFQAETPRFIDGQFTHMISETATGGTARVEVRNDRFFTNPLNRFDVDRNGLIQPLDALRIINAIRRLGSGPIALPTNDGEISNLYFDVSGDNNLTALDALRVINAISRINRGQEPEGESSLVDLDAFSNTSGDSHEVIDMAISEFEVPAVVSSFGSVQVTQPTVSSIDDWMEELASEDVESPSGLDSHVKGNVAVTI